MPEKIARLATVLSLFFVVGCSSGGDTGTILDELDIPIFGDDSDTMSGETDELIMPPDLDNVEGRDEFRMPGEVLSAKRRGGSYVLPESLHMRIFREGGVAWLEVNADPVSVWPEIERFWRDRGFRLAESNPRRGYMVTNWRARVPGRRDSARGARVSERFITRLSRQPQGQTHVYIANRRDAQGGGVASDTDTEVAMLQWLQDHLASSKWVAEERVGRMVDKRVPMDIKSIGGVPLLEIGEGYSMVWRRLIVVLQRVGFVVRDSDRSRGNFIVSVEPAPNDEFAAQRQAPNLFEFHLVAKGRKTTITAHAYGQSKRLEYSEAQGLLRQILNGYYTDDRKIL